MTETNIEIDQKKEILISRKLHRKELEKQFLQITKSNFYKKWQKYIKIKKLINPKTYFRFIKNKIKKYKYDLSDFEMPHHDFIILKTKTDKWKIDGYEKVGEDWHIRIIRIADNKIFLFDQPFFYYLQIYKNNEKEIENEFFITYGVNPETIKKMKDAVEKLKL